MADSDDLDDNEQLGETSSPVVRRAIKFQKLSASAEEDNRTRGLAALRFAQGGEAQWLPEVFSNRMSDPGGTRPCESYNQIPNFLNQVVNDGRMNMAQSRFQPGEDGVEETAEKMEDCARNIQQESDAEISYDNALYGQCTPGWGYWRYVTDYENDKSFDQIIKVKPVWNPFTVYDDPYAAEVDKLDRKELLQVEDVKLSDFNNDYDKEYSADSLQSIGDDAPGWATGETIRVAEYWELTFSKSKLYCNKKTLKVTKEKPSKAEDYDTREVNVPKVMWYKLNAREVLDSAEWPGVYIPYVKVVGNEVNINGNNVISGMVERLMPAQRQMNYWTNAATEAMALAPKSPWIVDPESIAPFQEVWDNANTRNYAYLPAASRDGNGNELRQPQRNDANANLNGFVLMVQQAQQNFYNLSGIFPASLGQQGNESSGIAIQKRQKEGDVSTFHIHDNMARGQRAGGRILADLIPKIYDGSRTITGKKEDGTVYRFKVNQRYNDENGESKEHDFTKGTYDIAVTTGPSDTTKRSESSDFYQTIIQAAPQLLNVIGDIAIGANDMAGAEMASERMKKFIMLTTPGLIEDDKSKQKIPMEVQQQLQQLAQQNEQYQQIIQQGTQEIQQLQQQVQSKQADYAIKQQDYQVRQQQIASDAQQAQNDNELKQMQMNLDNEKLEIERIKLQLDAQKLQLDDKKMRLDAKVAMAPVNYDMAMNDPDLYEGAPPTQQLMVNLADTLTQGLQQVANMTAQSTQAMVESNQMVAQAIMAPKVINLSRDPQTNLVQGAVTETVQ